VRSWDPGQDVGYYFLGGLLPPFFTVLAAALVAWFAGGLVPAGFYAWVGRTPFWLRVVAMVVLGDLAFYWAHRWAHEIDWLWRLHSIHTRRCSHGSIVCSAPITCRQTACRRRTAPTGSFRRA
jgi:sterol desaturase/sphingolipid hydroxylase (fatty acid hydroxylase superfamily)